MGVTRCLLVFVWLSQIYLVRGQVPLLASSNICKYNPTRTTIALEKPYCFNAGSSAATVLLYVVKNDATNLQTLPTNTYASTNGGSTAPYVAATFANPNCTDDPVLSQLGDPSAIQSVLNKYVIRVGNDENCFGTNVCNGPLQNGTAYRFSYVFYNANQAIFASGWSSPISTRNGKLFTMVDTWPGRRSGGMIVLTSILSVLMFLVLTGLIAAVISNLMNPSPGIETTVQESQTTRKPDAEYDRTLDPGERYSTQP